MQLSDNGVILTSVQLWVPVFAKQQGSRICFCHYILYANVAEHLSSLDSKATIVCPVLVIL